MFRLFDLKIKDEDWATFDKLCQSVKFEDVILGRKGVILQTVENNKFPIVRTTHKCLHPTQHFTSNHKKLIDRITSLVPETSFNNALMEIYDNRYHKMAYHSDMALDLEEKSFIGVFSCYSNPKTTALRTLSVQNKKTRAVQDITLAHQSVVIFSTEANAHHVHKITLASPQGENVDWVGITFRLSKTFVTFRPDTFPYFCDTNTVLRLARDDEKRELYKQRKRENTEVGYVYYNIDYTLSPGDLMLNVTP